METTVTVTGAITGLIGFILGFGAIWALIGKDIVANLKLTFKEIL